MSSFLALSDSQAAEESVVVEALEAILVSRMTSDEDLSTLQAIIREVFPTGARQRSATAGRSEVELMSTTSLLNDAVVDQLRANNLDPNDGIVDKV